MTILSFPTKEYASVFEEYFHLRLCNTMFTKTYESNRPYLKYGIPCHMRNTTNTTTAPICPKIPAKQEIQAVVDRIICFIPVISPFYIVIVVCIYEVQV